MCWVSRLLITCSSQVKLACLQVQSFRLNLTFIHLLEDPLWYRKICMVYNGLFAPSDSYGLKNELDQQLWQLRCSQGSTPPTISLLCSEIIKTNFSFQCSAVCHLHTSCYQDQSLDLRPCVCNHSSIAAQNCIARFHCMASVCNHSLNLICNFEFGCLASEAYLLPSEYSIYDYFHVFGRNTQAFPEAVIFNLHSQEYMKGPDSPHHDWQSCGRFLAFETISLDISGHH